ncbi:hypothetical protein D3C77_811470 [compost metagenome]
MAASRTGLCRPPPQATTLVGFSEQRATPSATASAAKAVSVAAASSSDRPATGSSEKSKRSSDFGPVAAK